MTRREFIKIIIQNPLSLFIMRDKNKVIEEYGSVENYLKLLKEYYNKKSKL